MKRRARWLIGGVAVLGVLATASPLVAGGIDDFTLSRAIPADAMLVAQWRDHDGKKFVNEQFERVWSEFQKQHFEKDIKRLLKTAIEEGQGDSAQFEQHWQQITDLAAGVTWSGLWQREGALALKLGPPTFVEFVLLTVPAADQVGEDFAGLTAMLKHLVALAPEGQLILSTDEAEGGAVHKLSMANSPVPLSLMLARYKDAILVGFGSSMPEQALALLHGGKAETAATLASSQRFQAALKQLPAPTDSVFYLDMAKVMGQVKTFAGMAATMGQPASAPAGTEAEAGPMAFLVPMIDSFDLVDYMAGVAVTAGMKTSSDSIAVMKADAKTKPFGKVFCKETPLREPLKYIPKEATGVSVSSGIDFQALYAAILDFVKTKIPNGEQAIAQWEQTKAQLPIDIEEDLLAWIGGGYATFTAPIPTPFMPGSVLILDVKDEAKAKAALAKLCGFLDEKLAEQNGGTEDAKLEGADGFKRIILPPMFALVPMLGRPILGIKDGHMFIGNGPEVIGAALQVAAGKHDSFAKSERLAKEGLPLSDKTTGFVFKDLTGLGDELSQGLTIGAVVARMMPGLAKNPAANAALLMLSKLGTVVKQLNFYSSSCEVTTSDGTASHTKAVTHYREPPKKPSSAPAGEEEQKPELGKSSTGADKK